MSAQPITVQAECTACRGTGIYRGFAEPPGVGVICLGCNGSGAKEIRYVPFTSRKRREDVRNVSRSAGNFIGTGVGPTGGTISYEAFLRGEKP